MIVGTIVADPDPQPEPRFAALPLAQREVALLVVLSVAAGLLFATTRLLAGWARHQQALEAATWYDRGEAALHANQTDAGLDDLRHAVAADRTSVPYALALARGLATAGHDDEAWQILQRLRGDQPEFAEINYRLARLAVKRQDLADAIRYYHNAMYGTASADPQLSRHAIAIELASVLLAHGDRESALAELIALTADLAADSPDQLSVADLFLQAGDPTRALQHFQLAAKIEPDPALTGAGKAALALHDFPAAEQYWRDASRHGADVAAELRLVRLVLATDPLAARITPADRAGRLGAGLAYAAQRLSGCRPAAGAAAPEAGTAACAAPNATGAVDDELARFRAAHTGVSLSDQDVLAQGVALVARAVAEATRRCGPPAAGGADLDRAWQLIAGAHRSGA